jgi:hypothetical protein
MGAETAGRKLGIGLRLAAKAARERAGQVAAVPTPSPAKAEAIPAAAAQATSKAKAIAQGTKRFGEAVWGPMAHTGSVLWLEITGLFFALIALFFGSNVYKFRLSWKSGPDHKMFLLCSAVTILFAAFTASQFYRARQKEKKKPSPPRRPLI